MTEPAGSVGAAVSFGPNDMRSGSCPLCGHGEVIFSFAADIGPRPGAIYSHCHLFPEAIAYDFEEQEGRIVQAYGRLQRYTCRRCGLVQTFADAPAAIPIDGRQTTLIKKP